MLAAYGFQRINITQKENEMEDWEGRLSNCCGAEIVCHDVCSACKEHCEPQDDEEESK
jgi:hypothetical protein